MTTCRTPAGHRSGGRSCPRSSPQACRRLAIGDLRAADVRVDRELAQEPVDDDLEVQLAHPAMSVWPVSSSVPTRKVGSSSASRWSAVASLSWSAFVVGSIATEMTGSGKSIDSSRIGAVSTASVSPVVVCLRPTARRSRRADLLPLLAVVRVHLEDAPDRSVLPVVVLSTLSPVNLARVDAEVGELADVGIAHDLEGECRERLVVGRAA